MKSALIIFFLVSKLFGDLPFHLIKKETLPQSPTLFIIAGIHGNEPGSYFAAAFLSQYYTITKGNVWIVPDLNRDSILQNSRGIYGDMNRKFAEIALDDPDYPIVKEIQTIIQDPQIGLILNLHDGHGFYRKEYESTIFNPNAWGQTCVIDQVILDDSHPFGNLNEIASRVSLDLNRELLADHHAFNVRNTNTRFDDEAMRHSLTYFAVSHNKPAFAIETSKNLPTLKEKVYYQLKAIENFMHIMGIEFKTKIEITPSNIEKTLIDAGYLTINNSFYLNLNGLKNSLSFVPLQSGHNDFKFSHPLGATRKNGQSYDLFIGNQKISSLNASYHEKEDFSGLVTVKIDGITKNLKLATDFFANADFQIVSQDKDIRVNVIGFTKKGIKDESNIPISLQELDPKYAIDSKNKSFRIEFYRKNKFCGMLLVHFK